MPDISVIIPVRNEEKHIAEVLDRLLEQEEANAEFLVVDGCSTDTTRNIVTQYAQKHPNIKLLENPKRLSSAARNIGVQNAAGQYVLVVDGHCIIDNRRMIANVIQAFETSGADCLARPQPLEMQDATPLQWAIASARRSPLGHNPDSLIYSDEAQFAPASSAAIAYRKSVFEEVGYFDESFDACEDVEFNTRIDKAGLRCWFDPAIAVRYVPRKTLSGLFFQLHRYGRGRVKLFRKHRETFSRAMFGLGAFMFCLIAGFIALTLSNEAAYMLSSAGERDLPFPWFRINDICALVYCSVLLLYITAVLIESLRLAFRQERWSMFTRLPFVFAAIHFGFGSGIVLEMLGGFRHR